MEGALTILKTMFAKPVEFMGELRNTNLFKNRPETRFLQEVQTLQSLGLFCSKHGTCLFYQMLHIVSNGSVFLLGRNP
jgi:hypothetical protein